MARPRAIQGEVEERLLYALEQGTPVRLACEYAGVSVTTLNEERDRNPAFAAQVQRARVKHLPKALEDIRSEPDFRAKKAWVEMNFPGEYRHQVEVTQAEPLRITLDFGSREQTS